MGRSGQGYGERVRGNLAMKRIGIITIQKCNNYGADLQAYALCAKLRSMGYDAENIDYLFYKHKGFKRTKLSRPIFRLTWINRLKELLFPMIQKFLMRQPEERERAFNEFFKDNIKSSRTYSSVDELYNCPPTYDVYITGSDQVWNPRMGVNIKPYFLDFVPPGKRCIAYAASIGVPFISPMVYKTYMQLLQKYSAIGVREPTAERIVGGMGLGVPVKAVVDPTLLLTRDDWLRVSKKPHGVEYKEFLVEYNLGSDPQIHRFALKCAAKLSVKLIDVTFSDYGPAEFVWLMANAKASVVASFHGTVFSVLHGIPFYSVYPESSEKNGGRIALFAHSLGLDSRMIPYSELDSTEIDFDVRFEDALKKLEDMRVESCNFLRGSIEGTLSRVDTKLPLACYALWAEDENVRRQSTSGGAFYLLAKKVIESGGVVFGAAFDQNFHYVRHRMARTTLELVPLMKSKYVQSDISSALNEAYDEVRFGRLVLFSGTPCQIAAVKAKCREYSNRLITVDLVCHGAPRQEIFDSYMSENEKFYGEKIVGYEFRNKRYGWNFGMVRMQLESGTNIWRIGAKDPYITGFSQNVFLLDRCYSCRYARLERISDLTIADCWRVAATRPEFDDNKGTSLVLVNTIVGENLFSRVRLSAECQVRSYDISLARLRNTPLMYPPTRSKFYHIFKSEFAKTSSFHLAARTYFRATTRIIGIMRFVIKRIGWFYLKRHQ